MNNPQNDSRPLEEQLNQLFGSYKAEWLREQVFELFTEPTYFPELKTPRSCILIGGRGTGKTTVLRGLSFEGQFALSTHNVAVDEWPWYGLYYRINTNHVTAFAGPELHDKAWVALFAHYTNVLLCELILEFLEWYELHTRSEVVLDAASCARVAKSLHLGLCTDHRQLRECLIDSRVAFEAYINNVVDVSHPPLSLQAAPLDLLCRAILGLEQFRGKHFFFLLDEYENLLDYQQQIINTLIKHSGTLYSFKIGVRELGWRCRSTLNRNEQLIHPADYARVNIAEKMQGAAFDAFAFEVCKERISRLDLPQQVVIRDPRVALPGLTEDEEARKLGVDERAEQVRRQLLASSDEQLRAVFDTMSPLECYFVGFWAEAQSQTISQVLREAADDPIGWNTRYGNYKHALLYTIRRRKRGIRRYYCGWDTFTQMAAGNIRYVLALVDQSFLIHFRETDSLSSPVTPEQQTTAAQRVGSINLSELEGLSVDGAQLTKLLLSLGRVLQVMAKDPTGHAPEINQFEIADTKDSEHVAEVERLLNAAVMHLALLRSAGNKPADVGDTKDYDYCMHPIYSALFEFSPRRKRKMLLSPDDLLGFVRNPKATIRRVLAGQRRVIDDDLPEQLTLFERFYNADT